MDTYFMLLAFINSLIMLLVFVYLYYQYRDRYVGLWCLAGLNLIIKLVFDFTMFFSEIDMASFPILFNLVDIYSLSLGGFFMLAGSCAFINKPLHKIWLYSFTAGIIWSFLGIVLNESFLFCSFIPYTFMALSLMFAGINILKYKGISGMGKALSGGSLIIWSLDMSTYLYFRVTMTLSSGGYFAAAMISLIVTICLLDLYFQRMKNELSQNEKRFRLLAENAQDMIFRFSVYPTYIIDYISPSSETIIGYKPEEFYQDPRLFFKIIHLEDFIRLKSLKKSLNGDETSFFTIRLIHKDNHIVWLEQRNAPVVNEFGEIIAYEGIARDITERKKVEKELKYLSQHDTLTGLGNRLSFEEKMKEIEKEGYLSLGILVCDIDGLKIVNDTFGHVYGDHIIKTAADVLKTALDGKGAIARIGGDEFAVILKNYEEDFVEKVCYRINEIMAKHNISHPEIPINMSLGYYWSQDEVIPYELFKHADNEMYKDKMKKRDISRISIVNAIKKAMVNKDFGRAGHFQSLQKLTKEMAILLELSPEQRSNLYLLAFYHDIGKVGISDSILFKPGQLTREEILEMRKHCEIGYRIAQITKELAPIDEFILKHHEWWDGTGYPLGLKGENIPLECRILALADAYDAMTSNRPYRRALSSAEALQEINKCSGTQFDPNLTGILERVVLDRKR